MSLVNEVGSGLDGLSQLRALIASGRKPGILVALDFEFVEVEAGKAVFAGRPRAEGGVRRGQADRCAGQVVCVRDVDVARVRPVRNVAHRSANFPLTDSPRSPRLN